MGEVIDQLAALLFIHDPLCRRQKLGRLNDADGAGLDMAETTPLDDIRKGILAA
jgi:hypothetical protein